MADEYRVIRDEHGVRLATWRRRTDWLLLAAALAFLVAYSTQVIADADGLLGSICAATISATWLLFVVDYAVKLVLAENRLRWFVRHLPDLAMVLLPVLRPLQLLRLITVLQVLQRTAGALLRGRIVIYAAGASALLIWAAALAILDAERGQGGSIETFGDALWWAFVTVTTVGYGDFFPVTFVGRLVATMLMIGGIALIGVVTASLSSWIVERVSDDAEQREASDRHRDQRTLEQGVEATREELTELRNEVRSLRDVLASRGS